MMKDSPVLELPTRTGLTRGGLIDIIGDIPDTIFSISSIVGRREGNSIHIVNIGLLKGKTSMYCTMKRTLVNEE